MTTTIYEISGIPYQTHNNKNNPPSTSTNWPPAPNSTANHITFLLRHLPVPDLIPPILHQADILTKSTHTKSHPASISRSKSPHTYLTTPPIHSRIRRTHPVVKIVFTIVAEDVGLDLGIGQSHFCAGVIRSGGGSGAQEVVGERFVVRNTPASDLYERHVVEWRRDSEDPGEAAWLSGLRNGVRIVVRAFAQWASFENRVASVEVAVYTVALALA